MAYQNVYFLPIQNEKDLLICGQILNFKTLWATPATAAVFYCNSSTTLASAMYYTMAEIFVQKSWGFFLYILMSDKKKTWPLQYIAVYCDGQVFVLSDVNWVKYGSVPQMKVNFLVGNVKT